MESDRTDGCLVVTVRGELDADTASEFVESVVAALGDHPSRVEIDASELSFLDSSGLSALLDVRAAVLDRDGSFRVVRPTDSARRVFEMSGLDAVFA